MDFTSQIETISEDALNQLFENSTGPVKEATEFTPVIKPNDTQVTLNDSILPIVDIDELEEQNKVTDEDDPETDPIVEKVEDPKEDTKKTDDSTKIEASQLNSVLKESVNFLVEKGLLPDFDGRSEAEIDEDSYAELLSEGFLNKAHEIVNELIDSTGEYGKAIMLHIKQGGNPDDIIDIFKEQKQIENFDISDPAKAEVLVTKYYQEEVGWNKTKTHKYLETLKASETGLEDEAKDIQEKYDQIYSDQLAEIKKQQQENENKIKADRIQKEKDRKQYVANLSQAIDSSKDLSETDKKLIKNSVLKFDKKLDNGVPVNAFYMKFAEMQKDPEQYIRLVHFVMDMEGYESKVSKGTTSEKVKKNWNFIKGNSSVNKNTGSTVQPTHSTNKRTGLNFSNIIK